MPYTVYETEAFQDDLNSIIDYLVGHLHNIQAAEKWLIEYEKIVRKLEEHSRMFEHSYPTRYYRQGYRKFLIGRYIVVYIIDDTRKEVWIQRAFHGSQDYAKYL